MDHAAGVRRGQRRRELAPDRDHAVGRQRFPLEHAARLSPSTYSITMNARPSCSTTSWTAATCECVDPRGGARFADDPVAQVLASLARRQQALQRDLPIQPGIPAEENLSHSSDAEPAQDDVRAHATAHRHIGPGPGSPVRRRVLRESSGAR